ncbi:restriction endonuclease subunit S [Pseudotamlana carrageenivorans]|uniref:Restriction endonuclease subunit S n=1 Tax=Pseudotamlana carrageenivorans TaxID=2069432 RepID=A0A2I7SGD4_9FLAO|nr:restriction endonuclease subunit S [Tamlana carrageenivorans]AUS04962.1 restriction endonuclease subunit S [Tamlana carrageenivorans]
MEDKKKSPELRFAGFTEDWEEHQLGELIDITSAARVHKNEWTKAGVPFFRSSDVVSDHKGTENTKAYISKELYDELSNKIGKVQKNDLLITGGGSIGIPYLIKSNDPLYFKDADLLWLKNGNKINGQFLYEFFSTKTFRNYVEKITHIGTISHYTVEQAKGTPISLPCRDEQDRVGGFIAEIDNLLQIHQKKHNRLVTLKKSMLEKMFPKEGQSVPEIRFKGFKGDWEEARLNQIATYQSSSLTVGDALPKGKYELYDANSLIGYTNEDPLSEDYLTIIKDGSGVGRLRVLTKNTSFIATLGAIVPNKEIDLIFLLCCLLNTDFNSHIIGATIPHVYFSSYGEVVYRVPSFEEQEKIGCYFKNLDTLITNHNKQLQKLNNFKQSLSEKMFV